MDEALADYTKAIEFDPKDALAFNNRGEVYYKQGKFDEALADYTKAIEINPKYDRAFNNRGFVYYKQGKLDAALADYTKAIDINPTYAIALYNRGVVYKKMGKLNEALADYTKAIEVNPKYAEAFYQRGNMHVETDRFDEAIADYTKVIEINSKDATAFNSRGLVYKKMGKLNEALADFTKAIDINPKYALAFYNRGIVYKMKGNFAYAVADFAESVRLNPEDEAAKDNLSAAIEKVRESSEKPRVRSLRLDEETKTSVVKKSAPIRLAANSEKVVEESMRVQHSMTIPEGWKAEAELRGKVTAWLPEFEAALRVSIGKSTRRTYGDETERKRSVIIKGSDSPKGIRVVWVEYYRTGVAKVSVGGIEIEVPFEFRDDFDLLTEMEK